MSETSHLVCIHLGTLAFLGVLENVQVEVGRVREVVVVMEEAGREEGEKVMEVGVREEEERVMEVGVREEEEEEEERVGRVMEEAGMVTVVVVGREEGESTLVVEVSVLEQEESGVKEA
jgi:hypothetical protein